MSADLQITQEDLMGVIPFKQVQGKKVSAFIRVKFQKKIFDKYGAEGVALFNKIDNRKSVEDIRAELNMTPEKIVEMLEYMEDEGVIELKTIFEIEQG